MAKLMEAQALPAAFVRPGAPPMFEGVQARDCSPSTLHMMKALCDQSFSGKCLFLPCPHLLLVAYIAFFRLRYFCMLATLFGSSQGSVAFDCLAYAHAASSFSLKSSQLEGEDLRHGAEPRGNRKAYGQARTDARATSPLYRHLLNDRLAARASLVAWPWARNCDCR